MFVLARRLVVPVVITVVASGCWSPQYRGNEAHSGAQPLESTIARANVSNLAPAWVASTGAAVNAPAAQGSGVTYVVATDGKLSAFDAAGVNGCGGAPKTCAALWTAALSDPFQGSPAVAGTAVLVQGLDAIYAFDAAGVNGCVGIPKTCQPLWRSSAIGFAKSSVTLAGGAVFATGIRGLNAFDSAGIANCTGVPKVCSPLWTSSVFSPSGDASPAVAGGRVYVSDGTSMFVFDAAGSQGCSGIPITCFPLWRAADAAASPAVVNNVVYLAGGARGLNAFDAGGSVNCGGSPKLCAPLWSTTLAASTSAGREPPAVADGVVYLPLEGSLYAFDATGVKGCAGYPRVCAPFWQTSASTAGAGVVSGAPTVANHVVYSEASDRVAAFDATGVGNCAALPKQCDPLWVSAPGPAALRSPVVFAGTVYAGSADGLHAFRNSARTPAPSLTGAVPTPVRGTTTAVTVTGSGFATGLTVATTIPGATLSTPTGVTPTQFTLGITVPGTAPPGNYALRVVNSDQGRATTNITFNTTSAADVASRAGIAADPNLLFESPTDRTADLAATAALGGRWMGIDVIWHWIQRAGRDSFDWTQLDATVIDARARGLQLLGTPAYSPTWAFGADCPATAASDGHCLPADPNDYARFVGLAAARYGSQSNVVVGGRPLRGSITHWQFWNEPNIEYFAHPKPDPARYSAMLQSGYLMVRAADPTAMVITGGPAPAGDAFDGTSYSPATWLRRLYAAGARGFFDAVGHHPYSFPTNPLEEHPWNAYSQTSMVYDVMIEFGDAAKKVWGTEMGAPTGTSVWSITEAQQAQWVRDYYFGWNTNFASFTGPMILRALRDTSADLASVWENTGLLRYDRTEKPAYPTYRGIMTNGLP